MPETESMNSRKLILKELKRWTRRFLAGTCSVRRSLVTASLQWYKINILLVNVKGITSVPVRCGCTTQRAHSDANGSLLEVLVTRQDGSLYEKKHGIQIILNRGFLSIYLTTMGPSTLGLLFYTWTYYILQVPRGVFRSTNYWRGQDVTIGCCAPGTCSD